MKNSNKGLFRYSIALLYMVSAVLKLIDLEATSIMIQNLTYLDEIVSKAALLMLILTEAFIACSLITNLFRKFTRSLLFFLSAVFIVFNLMLIASGADNCACFGASVKQSPYISLIKNIVIIIMAIKI